MEVSVFDLFNIGIGPSSSHTIGPMRAGKMFAELLVDLNIIETVRSVKVELFGSLAHTGEGHGTLEALTLGLEGNVPETVDLDRIKICLKEADETNRLVLLGKFSVEFNSLSIVRNYEETELFHPNAMRFYVFDKEGKELIHKDYFSIGGGFVVEGGRSDQKEKEEKKNNKEVPYPFSTAIELIKQCRDRKLKIYELMLENEKTWRSEKEIRAGLVSIAKVMQDAIDRGSVSGGVLPGGLGIRRRASTLLNKLKHFKNRPSCKQPVDRSAYINCHVSAWALAVAEENASFGRIVTAPTCGAAGILPVGLRYCGAFCFEMTEEKVVEYLLTAGAIGLLYKRRASISGAEVGCQGEVGVACSMMAAALSAVLGANLDQIEEAAEMGIIHHLGLTCDPVKGLVQIPCIERNAVAANQAVDIAHLVLMESGEHFVSLDKAISVMKETGLDMDSKYKETSLGGLAIKFPSC